MAKPRFGVGAFFLAHHADRAAPETSETADDRFIVGKFSVAGEWGEIIDQAAHIIEEVRALKMPRHLSLLPRGQRRIEVRERFGGLGLEAGDLVADGDAALL